MSKASSITFGTILMITGVLFLMNNLGYLSLDFMGMIGAFWPIGLILVGLGLILKKGWIAWSALAITIMLGIFAITESIPEIETGEYRKMNVSIEADEDVTEMDVDVSFGMGELKISKNNAENLGSFEIGTSFVDDPDIRYEKEENKGKLDISMAQSINLPMHHEEYRQDWIILLNPNVPTDLSLDYGAADTEIDMQGMMIRNLHMDFGMADTDLIFGSYPTYASISTGMADIDMKFPKDACVKVKVDGGMMSTNLHGFRKEGKWYFSSNYDDNKSCIVINFEGGMADLSADFY